MKGDIVTWLNDRGGCHRCGRDANYYVPPYWDRDKRLCPHCCVDLDLLCRRKGWPAVE